MKQLDIFHELDLHDTLIKAQKTCAYSVLKMLKVIDNDVVIAGGAPRDWLFDRQAKDIDVYLRGINGESNFDFANRISQALDNSRVEDVTSTNEYVLNMNNGVLGVFNVHSCYLPVQVIRCDRAPLGMLATFHCSLSKAFALPSGIDNNLSISGNWEFDLSRKYHMNMIKKDFDPKYISKIQQKFPNFTQVFEQ